ncbi:hypothetical protein [Photobacterium damselae]|uniref:hypothetical protein n=1 Tax=Photobacterium damselae TaxID=38293 RepID=UPI004068F110
MKQILKKLSTSQEWRTTQLAHALNSTSSLLLTMLLVKNGLSEKNVLLAFAFIYALALIPLYFENYMQITKKILYVSSIAVMLAFVIKQELVIYPLIIFAASLQISRDMMFSEVISVYSYLSRKLSIDIKKVIAVAMTSSALIVCAANPILGIALSISPTVYFLFIGMCGLCISHNLVTRDYNHSYHKTHVKGDITQDFKYFCLYSFSLVTCRYFIRFFTIPVLILVMTERLGIGTGSFAVLGLIAGVAGVTSFINIDGEQKSRGRRPLYTTMFLTLLTSLLISLCSLFSHTLSTIPVSIMITGSYFLLEYTSKAFAVYQAAELRYFAEHERSRDYVYATFTKYRVFGGFVGFVVAFSLYSLATISISTIIVCCSIVISTYAVLKQIKNSSRGKS